MSELFELGNIYATPQALEAIGDPLAVSCLIQRHHAGDFGVVCDEDLVVNQQAIKFGGRILSAYPLDPTKPCQGWGANTLWIITEADRSYTTILLPDEY